MRKMILAAALASLRARPYSEANAQKSASS